MLDPKVSSQPVSPTDSIFKRKRSVRMEKSEGKRKKGVCTTLLTIEDLIGLRIEIVPKKELSGVKDHSLDVLLNVVSSRLSDESESIAESIQSDEVSNEVDSKENSSGSKLPKIESDPSENPGESESEMQKSRDSSEDSSKSNHVSDSSEDNVPIAWLSTKGKKKISEINRNPSKDSDDERVISYDNWEKEAIGKCENEKDSISKEGQSSKSEKKTKKPHIRVPSVPLDGIPFHYVDNA
ncbi:unnamed protein product [Citrullus colocynthis]|uniref:Uncharacterized protein n=1 Tax=Citrullus colocynthis TaxID=252529 RepID=A0ABP0ZEA0_9ROSI